MFSKLFALITTLHILSRLSSVNAIPSPQPGSSYLSVLEDVRLEERNDTSELVTRQGGYNTGIWKFTMYGYPDSYSAAIDCESAASHNPPQGSNTIAYPGCNHLGNARGKYAGGDGSYNNPLTAAAYPGSTPIPKCGVFFAPYLNKFLIFEDYCPSCSGSTPHFDVWIGGGPSTPNSGSVCQCELTLTPPSSKA
ncbi:hypothetical protein ONS95_006880 [Cadophora gregata]|uniref:uncharacterized protein n=1 Tax=Cadophora gregata TaxID=51156 RepID=UPI0026DA85C3|nr:uncharacterized protein ONS95_006880 [Cadophora gregata]KAK0101725.1 hypothetical protein ONS95_006880 [Cadophora gregata]